MSGTHLNRGVPREFSRSIRLPDFEVSCVAPHPFRAGLALGSDDGKLRFADENGVKTGPDIGGSKSGEAINGIASIRNTIVASSRGDVTVRVFNHPNGSEPEKPQVLSLSYGAHGICAAPGGYYVAPLGQDGIMMFLPRFPAAEDMVAALTTDKEEMYFYRVLAQPGRNGKDLLLCAAHHGGIGITEVQWGDTTYNMRTATFPELDAVDVCFVGGSADAPSIAAIGRDGTLVLSRDVLHDRNPIAMKFASLQGRAYRLFSTRGHLYVLTSSAVYGLMHLGSRLMQGLPAGRFTTSIRVIPVEAVDASLIGERWLSVVTPDEVLMYDLRILENMIPADSRDGEIRGEQMLLTEGTGETLERAWQRHDVSGGAHQLAA
jgi:hypothetical protein